MGVKKSREDQAVELHVWRFASKKAAAPHRMHALPLERIDPLIRVAHRRGGPHLNIPERVIVDHEILLILSGKGDLRFRDQSIPFGAHDVLFLQPFVPHALVCPGDVDHIAVHFDFSPRAGWRPISIVASPTPSSSPERWPFPLGSAWRHTARSSDRFRWWSSTSSKAHPKEDCAHEAGFVRVVEPASRPMPGLEESSGDDEPSSARGGSDARTACEQRDQHRPATRHRNCIQPADTLFRELTGYSPMEYLRRLRIERARELLANPSLSIKEVADGAGFSDPNHFSRVFARLDGIPPTAYRALLPEKRPEDRSPAHGVICAAGRLELWVEPGSSSWPPITTRRVEVHVHGCASIYPPSAARPSPLFCSSFGSLDLRRRLVWATSGTLLEEDPSSLDPSTTGGTNGPGGGTTDTDPDAPPPPFAPSEPVFARLTRPQYANVIRDLFGTGIASHALEADSQPLPLLGHRRSYQRGLGARCRSVQQSCVRHHLDRFRRRDQSQNARTVQYDHPADRCVPDDLHHDFGLRAWRRPLDAEEQGIYHKLGTQLGLGDPLLTLPYVASAMLQSPNFLYRVELGEPAPEHAGWLRYTGYEMASRLSFLLA